MITANIFMLHFRAICPANPIEICIIPGPRRRRRRYTAWPFSVAGRYCVYFPSVFASDQVTDSNEGERHQSIKARADRPAAIVFQLRRDKVSFIAAKPARRRRWWLLLLVVYLLMAFRRRFQEPFNNA